MWIRRTLRITRRPGTGVLALVYQCNVTRKVTVSESSLGLVSLAVSVDPCVLHRMAGHEIYMAMTYPKTRVYLFEFFSDPQRVHALSCLVMSLYSTAEDVHKILNNTNFSVEDLSNVVRVCDAAISPWGRLHSEFTQQNKYVFASHPKVYVLRKRHGLDS